MSVNDVDGIEAAKLRHPAYRNRRPIDPDRIVAAQLAADVQDPAVTAAALRHVHEIDTAFDLLAFAMVAPTLIEDLGDGILVAHPVTPDLSLTFCGMDAKRADLYESTAGALACGVCDLRGGVR